MKRKGHWGFSRKTICSWKKYHTSWGRLEQSTTEITTRRKGQLSFGASQQNHPCCGKHRFQVVLPRHSCKAQLYSLSLLFIVAMANRSDSWSRSVSPRRIKWSCSAWAQCRPHYNVRSWHDDWLKTLKLMDSIAHYPRGRAKNAKGYWVQSIHVTLNIMYCGNYNHLLNFIVTFFLAP